MVRIQDSQSWHRGSIPLSTTILADGSDTHYTILSVAFCVFSLYVLDDVHLLDIISYG